MIFFNEQQLRNAIRAYLAHYHRERNHQRLENQIIEPDDHLGVVSGPVVQRQRTEKRERKNGDRSSLSGFGSSG